MSTLLERDQKVLWHPYTQHGLGQVPLAVKSAHGAYLTLEDGTQVLDAISSWWVNILGHGHPAIVQAIAQQAATLDHVIFAGFTHEPAVALAERLIGAARSRGTDLSRVFYSDNGSTAVEVALKMAYQAHLNRGETHRKRFIALRGAYHGDTFGAMAVSEPNGFHVQFRDLLAPVDFVDPDDLPGLQRCLDAHRGAYAAMIVEPMVQGAGGMRMHTADYLKGAEKLCRDAGVYFICDEVFTGFYRTGKCFAFEHANLKPDLVCLSKGITAGFLPLSVTLTTEAIFQMFSSQNVSEAFLHGHSYTANPITCAAACASWDVLHLKETQSRIDSIVRITAERVTNLSRHPRTASARYIGTLGVIELRGTEPGYFSTIGPTIKRLALEQNVLLRPLGNVVYALPPYCSTDSEVLHIYGVISDILDQIQ